MKRISLFKRIIVIFCCTLLLSTSIFMSYSTAVHADDEYNLKDAVYNVLDIAAIIVGLLAAPETGGMSLLMTAKGILDIADDAENIYNYVTDNGDGTYTIDADFIQSVVDAAIFMENQGFTDTDVEYMNSYLYNYKWVYTDSYIWNDSQHNKQVSVKNTYNMATEKTGRVAGFKSINSFTDSNGRTYINYRCNVWDKNTPIQGIGKYICIQDGEVTSTDDSCCRSAVYGVNSYDGTQENDIYNASVSFGGNFPIFSDYQTMMQYINTGQGYRNAENYRPAPIFRRHSSYTPTYSGGAVTVHRTVIDNINTKISEVDADDSLSDDQKIEMLQQYIFSGGIIINPTPNPTPNDPDYDDNKDLSSGTDLTDTNSWLKKIYLKVCQIYAKMNTAVEEAEQTAFDKISESIENLQKMLKMYLSEITGDLDDIKGQLEEMSEQEFSEKMDDFIDDTMVDFSEIGEKAKGKFPFSIPNDIRLLISKMSVSQPEDLGQGTYSVMTMAYDEDFEYNDLIMVMDESVGDVPVISETGAPIFYIPFFIESAGIDDYVVIDLSGFESISSFCRSLMTIFFILCLFNLTFKVIGLWGDLVD